MRILYSILIVTVLAGLCWAQVEIEKTLEGKVVDGNGFAVAGAEVEIRMPGNATACNTDNRGIFKCKLETDEKLEITIRADGFSILRQTIANIQEYKGINTFVLIPGKVNAEVIVTAVRAKTSLEETPASILELDQEAISTSAASTVDGVLQQGVGFSLFRRTDSKTANPTTQGASLRGVNSSGASRAAVLLDGLPLNDPFGGWVIWNRVPKIAVERAEVLRGGASALFGSGSLGGTIGLVSRKTDRLLELSFELSGGSSRTYEGSIFAGFKRKGWIADATVSTFQTRGYRIVGENERGPVDDFANSRNAVFSISFARELGPQSRFFGSGSTFGEARNNGTPAQKNGSYIRNLSAGIEFGFGSLDDRWTNTRLVAKFFGGNQVFDQSFSAVEQDRASETLVRIQRVPAQRIGFNGQVFALYRDNSIVFGIEGSEVRGSSDETGFFGGSATSVLGTGGREQKLGLFFSDFYRLSERINLTGSIRIDRWENYRGLTSLTRLANGSITNETFQPRVESAVSPHAAILARIDRRLSVYFAAGRSFRAPTLNELYRGFRVGNVITDPNAFLQAERAVSLESGIRFSSESVFASANFFRTSITNSIANVTVDPGPPLILRQRRNAGTTRSQGLEIEAWFAKGILDLRAGYLYLDADVTRFSADPQIQGKRIPQVPSHQFTFQVGVRPDKHWTISVQGRGGSDQFDDDLNTFRLEKYFQTDAYISRKLGSKTRLFVSVENLFNSRYSVRLTPVRIISAPFSIRAGIRWN